MKQRLLWLFILTLLLSSNSNAQTFTVKGGLNLSTFNVTTKESGITQTPDDLIGFNVGGAVAFPLTNSLSFEPGIYLNTKGYDLEMNLSFWGESIKMKQKMNLLFLDINTPIKAVLDIPNKNSGVVNTRLYAIAGPYVGIGLVGKGTVEFESDEESEKMDFDVKWGKKKLSFDDDYDEDEQIWLNPLDYGLVLGAGIEYKSFVFQFTYNWGFGNMSGMEYEDDPESNEIMKNRIMSFSLGYIFGNRKTK